MLRLGYAYRIWKGLGGVEDRDCPVCGFHGRFPSVGYPPRSDAVCGACGSSERHRLAALAIKRHGLVKRTDKVIQFAPDGLSNYLRAITPDYQGADIQPGLTDLTLDLHDLALADSSVDVVLLIHVLEHVDDKRAMSEIYRVLKPGGRMIAMIPIIEGMPATYEDPAITDPQARTVAFGQDDHVRRFGRDFRDRVRLAGFELVEHVAEPAEIASHALGWGEVVFVGSKPHS